MTFRHEFCYFGPIPETELKTICDSDSLVIHLNAEMITHTFKADGDINHNTDKFKIFLQKIYNLIYDESAFTDSLNKSHTRGSSSGGCFVATATMGDFNHPTVLFLRFFRDTYLLKKTWGKIFTKFYYKFGPYPAKLIRKNYFLRKISFYFIIKPLEIIAKSIMSKPGQY